MKTRRQVYQSAAAPRRRLAFRGAFARFTPHCGDGATTTPAQPQRATAAESSARHKKRAPANKTAAARRHRAMPPARTKARRAKARAIRWPDPPNGRRRRQKCPKRKRKAGQTRVANQFPLGGAFASAAQRGGAFTTILCRPFIHRAPHSLQTFIDGT